ncbi:hypothetical protein AOQ88_01555 [Candidatus Riesia sp. GBBU]|nr:hypothetical protein AOQ88_01555 [Candidatus Riesia sp. GBBU]
MKVIIVGAGKIGLILADILISQKNDVTAIDLNNKRLCYLQDKLDMKVINGNGSYPSVLRNAGAKDSNTLFAVTNSDEINIITCQIAHSLFNIPNKIARLKASEYINESRNLFNSKNIPIDYILLPEKLIVDYICKLIKYPGSLQVVDFADDEISIVTLKIHCENSLIGTSILRINSYLISLNVRIILIYREGKIIFPTESTIIFSGDEVSFISRKKDIQHIIVKLQNFRKQYKKIMIVGGGDIGVGLAKKLEGFYIIKLVERSKKRANKLSEILYRTVVLHGDTSDIEFLNEEKISQIDMFISVTNEDESNIMYAMLAKKMGAKNVVAIVNHSVYMEILKDEEIDIIVSPKLITVSTFLSFFKKTGLVNTFSLRENMIDIIEVIVKKTMNSKLIGKKISEINLPRYIEIIAVLSKKSVILYANEKIISENDHIILLIKKESQEIQLEEIISEYL